MFGGINPSKIQGMMKRLGISQEPLAVKRVIFEMEDKELVIENPSVIKVKMQGQESFQVMGDLVEKQSLNEEDVKLVMEKTGCSKEEAEETLKKVKGDIALAILELKDAE